MADKPRERVYRLFAMAFPTAAALVEAAMRRLEVEDKNTEFARKLGLDMHGPGRVGRWRKGEAQPEYEATMTILEKCGWLNIAEDVPAPEVASPDRLEAIAEAVAEVEETQKEILRELRAARPATQPSQPRGAPKPKPARKTGP